MTDQAIVARMNAIERDREYVEYMERLHDLDVLAARDVISEAEWRRQFADWAVQQ